MARRRKAAPAASEADASATPTDETRESSAPDASLSSETAAASSAVHEHSSPDAPANLSAAGQAPAADAAPSPPRRRRSSSRKTTEAAAEAPAAPGAELASVVAAEDAVAVPLADTQQETPPPARTSRRRGTRKSPPADEAAIEFIAEGPATSVEEPPPAPAAVEVPAAKPRRGRRSRSSTAAPAESDRAEATGTTGTAASAMAPTPLTVELRTEAPAPVDLIDPRPAPATDGEAASAGEDRPRRTRGVRARKSAGQAGAAAEPAAPTYQALPAETLARLAETRIVVRKNVPELVVNGEARVPFWFFVNTEDAPDSRDVAARQIKGAYAAGIRFFTFLAHLPWRSRTGERRTGPLDEAFAFVANLAPDAFLLPRLIFSPPLSWERAHPDEMTRYPDGDTGDVSLGSRAFWEDEAEPALRAAVEHVAQGTHAERAFGFYLEHGEWFYENGRGYDVSAPNVQAFRAWLRARYNNDVVALRAAWHDGGVTFESANVPASMPPSPAPGSNGGGALSLLYSERECRYRDFHEFGSDLVARVITRLGRAVKEASGNRSAVAVSYGYTLELPRAGSGHLALGTLLDSPYVDILTGPPSYTSRLPGGSAGLPAPVASVALAGKLWVSEDDTKTFLAKGGTPDGYNPRVESAGETLAVHVRNAGAALAQGAGVSWMDLWGQGWLDDGQVWDNIGRLRDVAERLATRRRNPRTKPFPGPDVAVVVDERSFFGVRADEYLLGQLVAGQRDALLRSGARIGFYLLSDLARHNFPDAPRLLLFLNALRFPADVRAALKARFQRDGRTLAFLYGPGCLEAAGDATKAAATVSEMTDVVGMHLRLQAWGSKVGTLITEGRSPLTDGRRGQRFGNEVRLNPSFYVADPRAQVLGEYAATGNPSLAVRKHAAWQSVFVGETTLTPDLLRGLYRLAGVPTYTDEDDVAYVGDSLVCLHSSSGGPMTLMLAEAAHLFDLVRGEMLARGGHGQRLHLRLRETKLLFFGTPAEVQRLGGDPNAGPPGLTRAELPPPPPPFVFETGTSSAPLPAAVSREEEDLMAAALAAGTVPIVDKDATPDAFAEADEAEPAEDIQETLGAAATEPGTTGTGKKRRRRRRGRRTDDEATEPAALIPLGPNVEEIIDADEAAVFSPSPETARTLPPLSELLPESENPLGDLPPVPDELLPLSDDDAAFRATPAEALEAALGDRVTGEAAPVLPSSRRRRGGGRSRRGGGGGGNAGVSEGALDATPNVPEAPAPFGETPGSEA